MHTPKANRTRCAQALAGLTLAFAACASHGADWIVSGNDLFAIRNGQAVQVAEAPGGEAAQGIVFTADSQYLIVQFNVEKQLALFAVNGGHLRGTGERIALSGGPSSLRTMPR